MDTGILQGGFRGRGGRRGGGSVGGLGIVGPLLIDLLALLSLSWLSIVPLLIKALRRSILDLVFFLRLCAVPR